MEINTFVHNLPHQKRSKDIHIQSALTEQYLVPTSIGAERAGVHQLASNSLDLGSAMKQLTGRYPSELAGSLPPVPS